MVATSVDWTVGKASTMREGEVEVGAGAYGTIVNNSSSSMRTMMDGNYDDYDYYDDDRFVGSLPSQDMLSQASRFYGSGRGYVGV